MLTRSSVQGNDREKSWGREEDLSREEREARE